MHTQNAKKWRTRHQFDGQFESEKTQPNTDVYKYWWDVKWHHFIVLRCMAGYYVEAAEGHACTHRSHAGKDLSWFSGNVSPCCTVPVTLFWIELQVERRETEQQRVKEKARREERTEGGGASYTPLQYALTPSSVLGLAASGGSRGNLPQGTRRLDHWSIKHKKKKRENWCCPHP